MGESIEVYNRATYVKERRELAQWWADELDALKVGSEAVPTHRKA
jgi:hypothetical protein